MKTSKFIFLILIFSVLPFIALFLNPLIFHTHDGPVHLARIAAWFKSAEGGQIPPRWASELNYGYGTPILIFIYPLPYFLSFCFLKLGFSLVPAFKIVIFLSFLFSGLFMFWAVKELLNDEKKGFLAALFYQFHSFRFVEIIVRGAFGEAFTYTFFPLAFLGLIKIFKGDKKVGFLIASVGATLLILSHNSVSLSFFAVLILFCFFFAKSRRDLFWGLASLGLGLGLASFYWLPALWSRQFTYGNLFMKDLYLEHFPSLKQLFLPNFLNQEWGHVHDIAVQIGFFPLLGLFISCFLLLKNRLRDTEKRLVIFCLLIFLIALLLMQSISLPLWQRLPLLRQFQFSWRLLSLVVLATTFTSLGFLHLLKERAFLYWFLIIFVILLSFPYWQPLGFDEVDQEYFWNYPLNTTYFGEANTIWAASPPEEYPQERVAIVEGKAEIKDLSWHSTEHRFQIEAETAVNVLDRTFFFSGWRVFVNGSEIPIQFQDPNFRGLLTFRLEPGSHQVAIRFTRTKDRQIAETLSLFSLGGLILFIIFFKNIKGWLS